MQDSIAHKEVVPCGIQDSTMHQVSRQDGQFPFYNTPKPKNKKIMGDAALTSTSRDSHALSFSTYPPFFFAARAI